MNSHFSLEQLLSLVDIKPYVLRFWETEFDGIQPELDQNGGSFYSQKNIDKILLIKKYLFEDKLSIVQAKQELSKNQTNTFSQAIVEPIVAPPLFSEEEKKEEMTSQPYKPNLQELKMNLENSIKIVQKLRSTLCNI